MEARTPQHRTSRLVISQNCGGISKSNFFRFPHVCLTPQAARDFLTDGKRKGSIDEEETAPRAASLLEFLLLSRQPSVRSTLILGFYGVLPHDFDGLVAQRIKIFEALRVAVCCRLVKKSNSVMPTCLGAAPTNATTFPMAVRKLRPLAACCEALTAFTNPARRVINYLEFGHRVGFWLSLSVKALNCRATKSGSCNH